MPAGVCHLEASLQRNGTKSQFGAARRWANEIIATLRTVLGPLTVQPYNPVNGFECPYWIVANGIGIDIKV
jgi:hypothetical protein